MSERERNYPERSKLEEMDPLGELRALAWLYHQMGKYDKAEEMFKLSEELKNKNDKKKAA